MSFAIGAASLILTTGSPVIATADGANDTIANALKGDWGQIKMNVRYRWEHVDQDGKKQRMEIRSGSGLAT